MDVNRICPDHLEFARYLDRYYGRAIAKNYLKFICNPEYMSLRRQGSVKHSEKALERANFQPKMPRPKEGWRCAAQAHIQRVGREILEATPNLAPKELEKAISKTYPFGGLKMGQGYRVWRKELKAFLEQVRGERRDRRLTQTRSYRRKA